MTVMYVIGPFLVKRIPPIYWMTVVYITDPSTVKKISLFIEWPSYISDFNPFPMSMS